MSQAIIAELLTVAKKLNNYALDATTPTAFWPDTTHYIAEVPTGKRWFVLGGFVKRDVSATLVVYIRDKDDNLVDVMASHAAATSEVTYPQAAYFVGVPRVLDAEEQVYMIFGVAQGATAYATCNILEVDI